MTSFISVITIPPQSEIAKRLAGADFHDCYEAAIRPTDESALDLYLQVVAATPAWINTLMALRNRIVRLAGLKNLGRGLFFILALSCAMLVQAAPQKVIVDMDIGDDIDDAFALALLLQSPELEIVGITTAWGDTALRAQLLERMLRETGHSGIPVAQGLRTSGNAQPFTQARYAQRGKASARIDAIDAIDFMLDQIKRQPGQITLLALGPLTNVGAAIGRDPATFRKLKQVAMMGGSVRAGYRKSQYVPSRPADKEYNIVSDIAAAQQLFASGVPIAMMPLDSTQIRLDEVERNALLGHGSPVTDALALLYHQWIDAYQPWSSNTPSLFDVVPVTWLIDPQSCPTTPLRIAVDSEGYTREQAGAPNADVCLASDQQRFFDILMSRLLKDRP